MFSLMRVSIKLTEKQRVLVADRLFELANFFAVGWIIGNLISIEKVHWDLAVIAVFLYFLIAGAAIKISG